MSTLQVSDSKQKERRTFDTIDLKKSDEKKIRSYETTAVAQTNLNKVLSQHAVQPDLDMLQKKPNNKRPTSSNKYGSNAIPLKDKKNKQLKQSNSNQWI